jgi:hypothetical protein
MIFGRVLLLIICILFCCDFARSQEYGYTHYDTRDGLPNSNVHGISQDKDGFIWFATETGFSRFDGTHFRNFTTADGLPSNEVFGTFIDSRNRIWITSFKNAICYYSNGKIHNQKNDSVLNRISINSEVLWYAEDSTGRIIITGRYQVFILSGENKLTEIQAVHEDVQRGSPIPRFFLNAGFGTFYCSTISLPPLFPVCINGINSISIYPSSVPESKGMKNYLCSDGNHFVFYSAKIKKTRTVFFAKSTTPKSVRYINDSLIAVYSYRDDSGIKIYNAYTESYTDMYLPFHYPHDVFEDRDRNIWMSTAGSGVFKLNPLAVKTYRFGSEKEPLPVFDIRKLGNALYAGSSGAQYWHIITQGTNKEGPFAVHPVVNTNRLQLLRENKTPVYINFGGHDFLEINKKISDSKKGTGNLKTGLFFNDTLLISSHSKTALYKINKNVVEELNVLHSGRSTCAYKKDGIYYAGTLNGLFAITAGGTETFLGKNIPILRNRISAFAETADGTLWIGTYEQGIVGYKQGRITANITMDSGGLSSNIVRCLYASGNNLWAGTEKGLNKIDLTGNRPVVVAKFTEEDGLNADIINSVYTAGSLVFAGTSKGLCSFDTAKIITHASCDIKITGITVSGKELEPGTSLILERKDNNISFQFAGLSFLSSGNILYRYRLYGLNDQWQTTDKSYLNYPSLPPGGYTLQLIAVNKFGDSSRILEQYFYIKPAIWETTLFRAGALLLFLGILFFSVQFYFRRVNLKERKDRSTERKIAELEQMALRAQMNPHFIFNCLNSIQHYILKQDAKGANHYLSRFAHLVRRILDNSVKLYIPLTDEIAFLDNYLELEQLQTGGAFTYSIEKGSLPEPEKIMVPNMVIQPYVENAVKHGIGTKGTSIQVRFSHAAEQNILKCVVEDNGGGIKPAGTEKSYHSKGMSITQERIEKLSSLYNERKIKLTVESPVPAAAAGTRVTIEFSL